jgi:hypothetical protein
MGAFSPVPSRMALKNDRKIWKRKKLINFQFIFFLLFFDFQVINSSWLAIKVFDLSLRRSQLIENNWTNVEPLNRNKPQGHKKAFLRVIPAALLEFLCPIKISFALRDALFCRSQ